MNENMYNVRRKAERKMSAPRPRHRYKDINKMILNVVSECELDLAGTFEGKLAVIMNILMYLSVPNKSS
jgi:hypothetical protein